MQKIINIFITVELIYRILHFEKDNLASNKLVYKFEVSLSSVNQV